jgi:guanylate kinase
MMSPGLLIVISGPSGVGKNTVINNLFKRQPGLRYSVSATTRAPRPNEIDGQHYFFLTEAEFQKKIGYGEFLEWAKVYENYYGTPKQNVQQLLESGQDLILDIEVQGALQVKRSLPGAVLIFLAPPSLSELKKRLIGRNTEPEVELNKRLRYTKTEFQSVPLYDYLIINREIDLTCERIECIIQAEKCKVCRQEPSLLDNIIES